MSETPKNKAELNEGQWCALSVLGYMWLRLGNFPRAERVFRALAAVRPDDLKTSASLAAALLSQERPGDALEVVERLLAGRAPAAGEGYLWLLKAKALWRLDRRDEAASAVRNYLALTPPAGEAQP